MSWRQNKNLVRTLQFKLNPESTGYLELLRREFRSCYNQYLEIAKGLDTVNSSSLEEHEIETDLIQNTRQKARDKALNAVENYFRQKDLQKNASYPGQKDNPMTASLNYREGYKVVDEDTVKISTVPHRRVKADIIGREEDKNLLRDTLDGKYEFGKADVLKREGEYYIHVCICGGKVPEVSTGHSTFIGVDINESNLMLTATNPSGEILDTLYLDYSKLKDQRNEIFTKIKRVQKSGKQSMLQKFRRKEENITDDFCHKLSRYAASWIKEFEDPVVVLENLKGMSDDFDYGKRMNKRLSRLPFSKLQRYIKYKSEWKNIPVKFIDPAYTSQRCPLCGHESEQNRKSNRFKCQECGHQDHADRNASINIAFRPMEKHKNESDVPSPKNFPSFWKVRLTAAGHCVLADSNSRKSLEETMPRFAECVYS